MASPSRDAKFAVLTLASTWGAVTHPLNGSWIAVNIRSPAERSIIMALLIMTANAAGIAGAQIFQAHDAPLYQTGFTVILSLACVGVAAAVVSNLQYVWLNRRLERKESSRIDAGEEGVAPGTINWRFSL